MDNPAAKTSNFALFSAVLYLITSCTEVVAREIDYARVGSDTFSCADRKRLKPTARGLAFLGLLARIINHAAVETEQRPIRGGRSVNIGAGTEKDLSITREEEHAIAP